MKWEGSNQGQEGGKLKNPGVSRTSLFFLPDFRSSEFLLLLKDVF